VRGCGQGARVKRQLHRQHTPKKSGWDEVARKKSVLLSSRTRHQPPMPCDLQDDINFLSEDLGARVPSQFSRYDFGSSRPRIAVRGHVPPPGRWQRAGPLLQACDRTTRAASVIIVSVATWPKSLENNDMVAVSESAEPRWPPVAERAGAPSSESPQAWCARAASARPAPF
jgi:hypothetical protein